MKVYWTQFAQDRLEDIYNYYEFKAGITIAKNLVNEIIDVTIPLNINPYLGQKEELLAK